MAKIHYNKPPEYNSDDIVMIFIGDLVWLGFVGNFSNSAKYVDFVNYRTGINTGKVFRIGKDILSDEEGYNPLFSNPDDEIIIYLS